MDYTHLKLSRRVIKEPNELISHALVCQAFITLSIGGHGTVVFWRRNETLRTLSNQ